MQASDRDAVLRSIFALGSIAVFAIWAMGNQFAAMLFYWWFSLFRPHEWMWMDVSSWRLPLVAAFLFFGWSVAAGKLPRFDNGVARCMGLYVLLTILSQLVSGCTSFHPILWDHVLVLVFVTLASERQLATPRHSVVLLLWAVLSFSYHASWGGMKALIAGGNLSVALIGGGTITGSNAVALCSAMCVFLLFGVLRALSSTAVSSEPLLGPRLTRLLRPLLPFVMIGLIGMVIRTDSRGSAIAFGGGVMIALLLMPDRVRNFSILTVLAVAFVAFAPGSDRIVDQVSSVFVSEGEERDKSAESRPHFWRAAQSMADDSALGVGIGCFPSQYRFYDTSNGLYGKNRSAHSSHFSVLGELGYPGFVVWVMLHLLTVRILWRSRQRVKPFVQTVTDARILYFVSTGALLALLVFVMGGTFYELTYNDFTWLIFAVSIACGRHAAALEEPVGVHQPPSVPAATPVRRQPVSKP